MPRRSRPSHRPARYFAKVPCQVVRERDFRLVADCVVDLSPGGALVGPADPVLTGERVIVSFPGVRGEWIDAEAVVARVVHGRRVGEHTRTLGLSFESLDGDSRKALSALLATRLPTAPGARQERRAMLR
ncbi:MAG TPA: PilZ domain-containing protein [Polyangiaceae bacterium]|nr:PilZ domain-containing protein [Polyangiaceae bacterium]